MYPHHLEKLAASHISVDYAAKSGFESVDSATVSRALSDGETSIPGDALRIPYRDLEGRPMLDPHGAPYERFRVFDTRTDVEERFRYVARSHSGSRPYIPAGLLDILERSKYLVITEGELKAASAVCNGIAAIGVGGVTMWAADGHKGELTADTPVHPEILSLAHALKVVVVLADSDAAKNQRVEKAMRALASAIAKQSQGVASCYAVCKQPKDLKLKGVDKVGLDDWIHAKNGDTREIESYLGYYASKAQARQRALGSGGYVPLGYGAGGVYYVWSIPRAQVDSYPASSLYRPAELMSLVGAEWALAAYPKFNSKGDDITTDWNALAGKIMSDCVSAGLFDRDNVRGAGVWLDDDRHLVVNGLKCWSPGQPAIGRVTEKYVYVKTRDIGIEADTEPASVDDIREVLSAFETFNFERKTDAKVMLGLVMLGGVAGALEWRPHTFINGIGGSGKSYLLTYIASLLGPAAVRSDESTEPGLRQMLGCDALTAILDESEADGTHIAKLLNFFRLAAGGSTKNLGSQDQRGIQYTIRALGIVAGINPPRMQSMDETRFLKINLKPVDSDKGRSPHYLLQDRTSARELGKKLTALMIARWDLFQHTQKAIFRRLTDTGSRLASVVSPVLAACYVAFNSAYCEDISGYIGTFDLQDDLERIATASDDKDFVQHLFGLAVQVTLDGKPVRQTLGRLIHTAAHEAAKSSRINSQPVNSEIGLYGLKVHRHAPGDYELRIIPGNPQFIGLFRGTKWANGDLVSALKKVPGASQKTCGVDRIGGGASARYYTIPLHDVEETAAPLTADSLGL